MTNSTNVSLSSVVENITPAMAEAYLQHNRANRVLNMAQVKYYAKQMKSGEWKLNGEAICFDENGNLTNGQHRLHAIIEAGTPVQSLVVRNTEEGSFATYDQGRKRSPADVFSICNILNATRTSAIVRRFHALHIGYSINTNSMGIEQRPTVSLSASEMVDLYNRYPDKFQEFGAYAACLVDKWHLYTATEIGAIMMHLNVDKGHDDLKIYRFFNMLFDYNMHSEDADDKPMYATALLRDRILRAASKGQKIRQDIKHALLRKVWNAYAKGEDLKKLVITETDIDYFI